MTKVIDLVSKDYDDSTLKLYAKILPAIKDWKVGGKYKVTLDIEEVYASKEDYENDLCAKFKVTKAKVC